MSYTKPNGTIVFSYKKDDLFNEVYLISSYRAKNIKTEEGESLLDEFALTEDERDAFESKLKDGIDVITNRLEKLVSDADYSSNTAAEITIIIKDRQTYNENVVKKLDRLLEDILIKSVLLGWCKLTGQLDDMKKYQAELAVAERDLNNKSFQLRKMKML
jgi:hypothetical protein